MCYVGKATKIFFLIVTVLVVTGLVMGFILLRRHAKSHKCPSYSCSPTTPLLVLPAPASNPTSANTTPNPPQLGPSVPDSSPPPPTLSSPPPPPPQPPIEVLPPPPPVAYSFSPPPLIEVFPAPPPVPVFSLPPPVASLPPPSPAVVVPMAPPPFSPPSPVTVTPGPVNNS